jgi:ABC-type glycerol-3-phosphate transport system substrate-binding protein
MASRRTQSKGQRWTKTLLAIVTLLALPGSRAAAQGSGKSIVLVQEAGNPELTWARTSLWPAFEKETGIKVNVVEIPQANMHEKYLVEFLAGSGAYDVVDLNSTWMPEFSAAGYLEPMTKYISAKEKAEFLEPALADSSYKGVLYGIPFISHTMYLYYRTDLFQAAGLQPPKTWEEYAAAAKKLTKDGVYGTALEGKRYISCAAAYDDWITRWGGRLVDDSGKVVIDSDKALAASKFMTKLLYEDKVVPPGAVNFDCVDIATLFVQGKLAMCQNWYFVASMADDPKQSKIVGKWALAQIPKTNAAGGYLGSFALGIPAASKNKEASWKLIKYFFDHYAQIRKTVPAPVTNKAALARILADPQVSDRQKALFKAFNDGASVAIPMPPVAQQSAIMDSLEIAVSTLMSKAKSPEDVLKDASKEIKQTLNQ